MIKQHLNLKLNQKLSPQQIQLMRLIQLSTLELEQKVQLEIGENPALETGKEKNNENDIHDDSDEISTINSDNIDVDDYLSDDLPYYKTKINNFSSDEEGKIIPFSGGISFHQDLKSQALNLIITEKEIPIIDFLIGSIDDSGYIRREVDELIDDLAFTENIHTNENEIKSLLKKVQSLDPPGVGAMNLQECLILQIRRKNKKDKLSALAEKILIQSFELFSRKHYIKLIEKYNIDEETLKSIIELISKLNPKPGGNLTNEFRKNQIIPDFILTVENGKIEVNLNKRNAPELHVSPNYKEMLEGYKIASNKDKNQIEAVNFIKQKLDSAKWFIDAVNQRYQTLFITIKTIVEFQKQYF